MEVQRFLNVAIVFLRLIPNRPPVFLRKGVTIKGVHLTVYFKELWHDDMGTHYASLALCVGNPIPAQRVTNADLCWFLNLAKVLKKPVEWPVKLDASTLMWCHLNCVALLSWRSPSRGVLHVHRKISHGSRFVWDGQPCNLAPLHTWRKQWDEDMAIIKIIWKYIAIIIINISRSSFLC